MVFHSHYVIMILDSNNRNNKQSQINYVFWVYQKKLARVFFIFLIRTRNMDTPPTKIARIDVSENQPICRNQIKFVYEKNHS